MKVDYLNPFIKSITALFNSMLEVNLTLGKPFVGSNSLPEHDVSGIVGLTGKAMGAAVVSLETETALRYTERLQGTRPPTVNSDVMDAVGDLANVVAGAANAQLQQLELKLELPLVITGKRCSIPFLAGLKPICIPFHCDWGAVALQLSLDIQADQFTAAGGDSSQHDVPCPPPARNRMIPTTSSFH